MTHRLVFSRSALADFSLIYDFLYESYLGFGHPAAEAAGKCETRLKAIRKNAENIARQPFQGTLHPELGENLRHVTIERAIYWFQIHEDEQQVRILAIFFGGQDHQRRMLVRLLSTPDATR